MQQIPKEVLDYVNLTRPDHLITGSPDELPVGQEAQKQRFTKLHIDGQSKPMIFTNYLARPRFVALLNKLDRAEEGTGQKITSKGASPGMVSGRNRRTKPKSMPLSLAQSSSTPSPPSGQTIGPISSQQLKKKRARTRKILQEADAGYELELARL